MPQFNSKYNTGELVEFECQHGGDSPPNYGFISSVKFRRTDSVNHTADYNICLVNSNEIASDVPESEIVRLFTPSDVKR